MQHPGRIATVLAADAAGCSRAMSLDEGRALAALAASRRIIDQLVAAGEFSSALFIAMRPLGFRPTANTRWGACAAEGCRDSGPSAGLGRFEEPG